MAAPFPINVFVSAAQLFATQLNAMVTALNTLNPSGKGSIFGSSTAGTPAELLPSSGGVLVSDSSTASGLNWLSLMNAGKNAIINGGMDIWQRGTSIALAASTGTTYLADRWCTQTGANQAVTVSRQATGDTTNLPNIQYAMRYQRNSGQTGIANITALQNLETSNSIPLAGKQVTISIYARAGANFSSNLNFLTFVLIYGTGIDQNAFSTFTGQANAFSAGYALTTTWQRYTLTGTIPATATQLALDINFTPTGTAGANDYFEITGVQLELGSTATTFSRAGGSIGGELALCQRYYWRTNSATDGSSAFGVGTGTSTTVSDAVIKNPVTMRIAPTSVDYAGLRVYDSVTATTASSLVIVGAGIDNTRVAVTVASGLTQYRTYELIGNSGTSYLGFSAEL